MDVYTNPQCSHAKNFRNIVDGHNLEAYSSKHNCANENRQHRLTDEKGDCLMQGIYQDSVIVPCEVHQNHNTCLKHMTFYYTPTTDGKVQSNAFCSLTQESAKGRVIESFESRYGQPILQNVNGDKYCLLA